MSRLPPGVAKGFQELGSKVPDERERVVQAFFEAGGIQISKADRIDHITSRCGVNRQSADALIDALMGLLHISTSRVLAANQVGLADLVDTILNDGSVTAWPSKLELSSFCENLVSRVEGSNFRLEMKVQALLYERERTFLDANILVDARPIFSPDQSDEIAGYVILSTLKIEYLDQGSDGSGPKTEYFSLDESDVKKLRDILDRADVKKSRVKKHFDSIGVTLFGEIGG